MAALLFLFYGVAVLVNAIIWQQLSGWVDLSDFPRAIVRLLGTMLIALGLRRGARWAWILGVGFGTIWCLAGFVALASMIYGAARGASGFALPFILFLGGSAVALGIAVVLLLLPGVRVQFRKRTHQQ